MTGTVDFYLADYRFENNGDDYLIQDWTWVDLTGLGAATQLEFDLDSSDVGQFGMNTPAYFAIDDIVAPEPSTLAMVLGAGIVAGALLFGRRRRGPD